MTEPTLPEGVEAVCLDCGQWLWMTDWEWADTDGREICPHRRTQLHVPAPANNFWTGVAKGARGYQSI